MNSKWQLDLQWKKVSECTESVQNVIKLIPSVTMIPHTEVKEKLGDVWIVPGKVTLCVDGSESIITLPSDKPIVLRKTNSYQCDLISKDSPIVIQKYHFVRKIVVKIEIIVIKSTLDTIEPVDIPPCAMLQNFITLLALNEEESKEKFCDMKITATQPASYVDSEYETTPQVDSDSTDNSDCQLVSYSEKDSDDQPVSYSNKDLPMDAPTQTDFYVHKAILASRSPVFAKMFSSDMLESATNTLTLPDIEPDVLKELLTYIYTGECPNIKEHALSLLGQAEKYELSHLKALCEEQLSYDLQIKNAARILVQADILEAKQLKRNALLFINKHGSKVQSTDDWEDVKKSAELLHDLVSTMYDNAYR